ncbi:MAG: hypothetical protein OXE41_08260 [Gammaproteobacteria bacterium]|nr:hypothetical protein [Gammaproteobacteria bacterium]
MTSPQQVSLQNVTRVFVLYQSANGHKSLPAIALNPRISHHQPLNEGQIETGLVVEVYLGRNSFSLDVVH